MSFVRIYATLLLIISRSILVFGFSQNPTSLYAATGTVRQCFRYKRHSTRRALSQKTAISLFSNATCDAIGSTTINLIDKSDNVSEAVLDITRITRTLWDFTRPHTLIGSILSIPALYIFAAPTVGHLSMSHLPIVIYGLIPSLLVNVYIVGLNQITDVEIDRINKPSLPLAAGTLRMRGALLYVGLCLLGGLAAMCGFPSTSFSSIPLRQTLAASTIIGTAYSVKPVRLKRFPLFAALCILTVRGAVVNVGFFAHALTKCYDTAVPNLLMLPFRNSKCGLATLFFAIYGSIIALMKVSKLK